MIFKFCGPEFGLTELTIFWTHHGAEHIECGVFFPIWFHGGARHILIAQWKISQLVEVQLYCLLLLKLKQIHLLFYIRCHFHRHFLLQLIHLLFFEFLGFLLVNHRRGWSWSPILEGRAQVVVFLQP